jgi:hypothetical protein
VSTALARIGDERLGRLVGQAAPLGSGIGGATSLLYVGDVPVFVKRVPLTDLERLPRNVMSTANLFGLPAFCHYGIASVGSPGFGAWRELAANNMVTDWVLTRRSAAFPLLYHWRVLPGAPPPAEEHADVERAVECWGGSPAVRDRLRALARASASVVLFVEYFAHNVADWLAEQLAGGADAVGSACALVERCLHTDIAGMNANGLLHFDAHFRNILTDGERLYLSDFGLATSARFDLSAPERDFLARNRTHDAGYAAMGLVNWLVARVAGIAAPGPPAERNEYIRRCAAGAEPTGVPAPIAAIISRHAPAAAVMNDFYWEFFGTSRATPYPAEDVERATAWEDR